MSNARDMPGGVKVLKWSVHYAVSCGISQLTHCIASNGNS